MFVLSKKDGKIDVDSGRSLVDDHFGKGNPQKFTLHFRLTKSMKIISIHLWQMSSTLPAIHLPYGCPREVQASLRTAGEQVPKALEW